MGIGPMGHKNGTTAGPAGQLGIRNYELGIEMQRGQKRRDRLLND